MPLDPVELSRVTAPLSPLRGKVAGGALRATDWNALVESLLGLATLLGAADIDGPPVDLSALTARVTALEGLGARMDALETRLGAVEAGLAAFGDPAALAALPARVSAVESSVRDLQDRTTSVEEGQRALGERVDTLEKVIDGRIIQLGDETGKRLDQLEEHIGGVDRRDARAIDGLETWRAGVDARLDGMGGGGTGTGDVTGLRSELMAILDKRLEPVEPLPKMVSELAASATNTSVVLGGRVAALEARTVDLDAALGRLTVVEADARAFGERARGLETAAAAVDRRLTQVEAANKALRETVDPLGTRIEELGLVDTRLEDAVAGAVKELSGRSDRLGEQVTTLGARADKVEGAIGGLRKLLDAQTPLVEEAADRARKSLDVVEGIQLRFTEMDERLLKLER